MKRPPLAVGALNSILRPHFGFRYHALSAFVPRLLVGAILVNTALWWVQFAIDVNKALAAGVGNATPPNWNALNLAAPETHRHRARGLPTCGGVWVLPRTQGWAHTLERAVHGRGVHPIGTGSRAVDPHD